MVITSILSKTILSSIVVPGVEKVNKIDELAQSDLNIYTYNNSQTWHLIHGLTNWNIKVNEHLAKIASRVKFFPRYSKVSVIEVWSR